MNRLQLSLSSKKEKMKKKEIYCLGKAIEINAYYSISNASRCNATIKTFSWFHFRVRVERQGGAWCPKHQITSETEEWLQVSFLSHLYPIQSTENRNSCVGLSNVDRIIISIWRLCVYVRCKLKIFRMSHIVLWYAWSGFWEIDFFKDYCNQKNVSQTGTQSWKTFFIKRSIFFIPFFISRSPAVDKFNPLIPFGWIGILLACIYGLEV